MMAKKIDHDGLILCDIQARAFELTLKMQDSSSEIFMRRFMHSEIARRMDRPGFLDTNLQARDLLILLDEEYGRSTYGSVRYSADELFWIGYLYRYFSYTYDKSSVWVYNLVKPKELRGLYPAYHTLDPSQAIERILEAKGLLLDEDAELQRQFEIYKRIRMASGH